MHTIFSRRFSRNSRLQLRALWSLFSVVCSIEFHFPDEKILCVEVVAQFGFVYFVSGVVTVDKRSLGESGAQCSLTVSLL